ncbi:TIGR00730 family Rossman fold protein [Mucilaginibacter sp. UR6-1]|uniref:LOG family protein n=1 Tax=Mucilaginibacter sp. UR6-1 TaxID=1435643 RepID=UPI001E4FF3E2|nr:TIGR00730 family Rossman fold protein [Mucilaginibacter sp. UR6-1]MCC8407298.1 TIGR00730 family Rossman fold protein [Mucilaginibacter sp. UR6-1]
MKAVCVYCGANFNGDTNLLNAIESLAQYFVDHDITLIFGGGRVGVMGLIADAVLTKGGKAIGIIPQFLADKEVAHTGLTELHVVQTMHERKQRMIELSDGIIALPGGMGTLDELFEAITWLQLGLHKSPVAILNINGFYDMLLKQLDLMVEQKFMKPANRNMILSSGDVRDLMDAMQNFDAAPEEVWFKK